MKEVSRYETCNRYKGSNWNYEHAIKYILQLGDDELVEVGCFTHFRDKKIIKNVIELPSSLGCPMRCKFCASSSIPFLRKLSVEEELMIFDYIYQNEQLTCHSPLVISFTGIGDIFFTLDTVENAILNIGNIRSDFQFTVSSCRWTAEMFKRIEKIYEKVIFRAIQITYISSKKDILEDAISYYKLDPADTLNFDSTIELIKKSSIPRCRINYLMLSGLNDSREDFLTFISTVTPVKEKIWVRISKLNVTKASTVNQMSVSTLERMEELKALLEENGIYAYLFYAMEDDGIGCGQLLSEAYIGDNNMKNFS